MNTRDPISIEPQRRAAQDFISGQKLAACYILGRRLDTKDGPAVWLAYDECRGREISLYFIPDSVRADKDAMEGIRGMVERSRVLVHPNILRVYGLVEEAHWTAIAMDRFDGETLWTLQQRKADGCFEPVEIAPWLAEICGALEEAHKHQVVHGDISLQNIYIQKSGRLLIANFGVSRQVRDQVDASIRELSASDDIRVFGVLMHTLLVGTPPPFYDATKASDELLFSISERRAELRKTNAATIPASWERTAAACLEKDPQFRPASAAEIAVLLSSKKSEMPLLAKTRESVKEFSSKTEAPAFARPKMPPIGMLLAKPNPAAAQQMPACPETSSAAPAQQPASIESPLPGQPVAPELPLLPALMDWQEVPLAKERQAGNRKIKALLGLAAAIVLSGAGIYIYCIYEKEKAEQRRQQITRKAESKSIAPEAVVVASISKKRSLPEAFVPEPVEMLALPPLSEEAETGFEKAPASVAQVIDPVKMLESESDKTDGNSEDADGDARSEFLKRQEEREKIKMQSSTPIQKEFENSLGMKFVPVGKVLFCIWPTRVSDFEAFVKETKFKSRLWKAPEFNKAPDYPVVYVSWLEAMSFCKWLAEKEHQEGRLPANQSYRLPYDLEWSEAIGLNEENGDTPAARDMGVPGIYPWGNAWPPSIGAGNYAGEETRLASAIKGYKDEFAQTSPVGRFSHNQSGLYDMGGNVWQWCMDAWSNGNPTAKVLRGASWSDGRLQPVLLSSCRIHSQQDNKASNYGFRCVIETAD